jgi:hypothetical protein
MGPLRRCALLFLAFSLPSVLSAQQRGIEIGLDGGLQYAFDAELLTISVPFQRVRAAFPTDERLAFEPALSFTRLSSGGESAAALALELGALYNFGAERNTSYARPFVGFEYTDASFSDGTTVFDLGIGVGSRSRIADRLALRFEGTATGRFPEGGGIDGAFGATIGLSFFTR